MALAVVLLAMVIAYPWVLGPGASPRCKVCTALSAATAPRTHTTTLDTKTCTLSPRMLVIRCMGSISKGRGGGVPNQGLGFTKLALLVKIFTNRGDW